MIIHFGKYTFYDRNKLRRSQLKAGKGAELDEILEIYLKMGGLVKNIKGVEIKLPEPVKVKVVVKKPVKKVKKPKAKKPKKVKKAKK